MKIKGAFLSVIQVGTVDDTTLELHLLAAGIDPDGEITAENAAVVQDNLEIAAVPVLQSLLSVTSVSQGGFSISTSKDGIKERLLFLANKHGLTDVISQLVSATPTIKARNLW